MTYTIVLPWIAFGVGLFWMFRQGDKAKKAYQEKKARARIEEITANVVMEMKHQAQEEAATGQYPLALYR